MKKNNIGKIILFIMIASISIFFIYNFMFKSSSGNKLEIIKLDSQLKLQTADYLSISNALYQKSFSTGSSLIQSIDLFSQGKISQDEIKSGIQNSNKKLTYYYLVSIQNKPTTASVDVSTQITYDMYLMRRGSEELLKYLDDKSTLRLSVGQDLIKQALKRGDSSNTLIANSFAKYDIDPNKVVVSSDLWTKEYSFISENPDLVIFKDLNSLQSTQYAYYLKSVSDDFMLVSWEIQNMYLSKTSYTQSKISADQLKSDLEKASFIINKIYAELNMLKAPEGLESLRKDVSKTNTLYHDSLMELNKFNMSNDVKYFDNAMVMIKQADTEAGRIGEFIYSVKYQYGF